MSTDSSPFDPPELFPWIWPWINARLELNLSEEARSKVVELKSVMHRIEEDWESASTNERRNYEQLYRKAHNDAVEATKPRGPTADEGLHERLGAWQNALQSHVPHWHKDHSTNKFRTITRQEPQREFERVRALEGPTQFEPIKVLRWVNKLLRVFTQDEEEEEDGLPRDIKRVADDLKTKVERAIRDKDHSDSVKSQLGQLVRQIQDEWDKHARALSHNAERGREEVNKIKQQHIDKVNERIKNGERLSDSEDGFLSEDPLSDLSLSGLSEWTPSASHSLGLRVARMHNINRSQWIRQNNKQ